MAVSISGYAVTSRLGEGGMGAVFKAVHELTGRKVAIKVLPPHLAADETYRKRFMREARSAGSLNHHNITKVYDVGEQNGLYYMVMEYVEGESIANIVWASGPLNAEYSLTVAREVAQGLAHAHENGIVHRDIKPDNIMLNLERVTKITDMGLAKKLKMAEDSPDLTQEGMVLGTPKYMSPEQILRPESVDHRTDIYSLGATLYFMLTGRAPFESDVSAQIIADLIKESPRYPKSLPRPVVRLLKTLLAKQPDRRPQNAQDAVRLIDMTLEELRRTPAEHSRESARPARTRSPLKRSAKGPALALVAVAAVVAVVLIALFGMRQPDRRVEEILPPDRIAEPPPAHALRSSPDTAAALKKYEKALEYAKNNPEDYAGIVERFKSILREGGVSIGVADQVQRAISDCTQQWEKAAKEEWDNTSEAADKMAAGGDYEGAAKLLGEFPLKYRQVGDYGEQRDAEAARLRRLAEVSAALKEIEPDIQAAGREFTLNEVGQAVALLGKLSEFARKYEGTELVTTKVVPAIAGLTRTIEMLQTEQQSKEFFKLTAPLIRAYDFKAALEACEKALKDAKSRPATLFIECEKRDIEALAGLYRLFEEKLRQAAARKTKIRLEFLDGTKASGLIIVEDDALVIEARKTYIVTPATLHPDTVIAHSGIPGTSSQNRITMALVCAYASFHEKAAQRFEEVKAELNPDDLRVYSSKLEYLRKAYPLPEKTKAVEKTELLPHDAQLWTEIGAELRATHRARDSAEAFRRALKLAPTDIDAASEAAQLLIQLHEYKDAVAVTRRVLSRQQDCARLLLQEALALHYMRKHRDALKRIDAAIAAGQDNSTSHMIRAGVLNMLRKHKEAREAAAEAIRKDRPDYVPASITDTEFEKKLEEAARLTKEGRFEEAGAITSKILAARPENALAYNVLGGTMAYRGRYTESLRVFVAASILDPKLSLAYINVGYCYAVLDEPDLAIATLELARGHKLKGEHKEALKVRIDSAKEVLEKRDSHAQNSYNQGKGLFEQRRFQQAISAFLPMNTLKNPSGYFWMGHCYRGLGQHLKAIRQFEKGILIMPDTHDNHYGKGLALKDLKKYAEAIESFKKCSEIHTGKLGKDHYESWVAIAECYRLMGEPDKAAEAQRKAQGLRSGR